MVKFRDPYYCNLKLLLMAGVILGHCIEPVAHLEPWKTLYRFLYMVHMPLFAFLSGLFLRKSGDCLKSLRRVLPTYGICQAVAVALGLTPWHTPWWYLWYLLSLSFWLLLGWGWFRLGRGGWWIPVLALVAGCLAGLLPLGRRWSLSRTVAFFPWFCLGLLCRREFPWHRLRIPGLLFLGIMILWNPQVSPDTLYQAGPCAPVVRLRCYLWALLLGVFLLSWCPRRRLPFSRLGADTMGIYLLHGPLVWILRPTPWPLMTTLWLLVLLNLAAGWYGAVCIVRKEVCHGRI